MKKGSTSADSPPQPAVDPTSPRRTPWWVKAFVPFQIFCVIVWTLPTRNVDAKFVPMGTDHLLIFNQMKLRQIPVVRAYMVSTGFWQYWDMFSPNPAQRDYYGDATVRYRDGKVERYAYPRIADLPILDKYPAERYRKFFERAHLEPNVYLWLPFAQTIARKVDKYPGNPPVQVTLNRHWRDVAAPGKPQATAYSSYAYYVYVVEAAVLRSAKPEKGRP